MKVLSKAAPNGFDKYACNNSYKIKHGAIAAICRVIIDDDFEVDVVYLNDEQIDYSPVKKEQLPKSVTDFIENQFKCVFMRSLADRAEYINSLPAVTINY